jgi:hypothetical protein
LLEEERLGLSSSAAKSWNGVSAVTGRARGSEAKRAGGGADDGRVAGAGAPDGWSMASDAPHEAHVAVPMAL